MDATMCQTFFSNWVFLESLPLVCFDSMFTLQLSLCDRYFFSLSIITFHSLGLLFCSPEVLRDQGLHDPVVLVLQCPSICYLLRMLHFRRSIHFKRSTTLPTCCWIQLISTLVLALSATLTVSNTSTFTKTKDNHCCCYLTSSLSVATTSANVKLSL